MASHTVTSSSTQPRLRPMPPRRPMPHLHCRRPCQQRSRRLCRDCQSFVRSALSTLPTAFATASPIAALTDGVVFLAVLSNNIESVREWEPHGGLDDDGPPPHRPHLPPRSSASARVGLQPAGVPQACLQAWGRPQSARRRPRHCRMSVRPRESSSAALSTTIEHEREQESGVGLDDDGRPRRCHPCQPRLPPRPNASAIASPRQPGRRRPQRCHPYPRRWWLPSAVQLCRWREVPPTPEPRATPARTYRRIYSGAMHIGDAFRQNHTRARLRAHSSPDDEAHGGAIRIPDGGGFLHPYSCADGERRRLLSRGQPLRGICRRILSGVQAPRQPRQRHPRRCHPYPRRWWLPPALQLCRRREAPFPEPRAAPTMIHRRIHDCTFRQNPTRARLRTHSSPDDNEHGGAIRIPDGGGFRQPYSCADGERHRFLSRGQPPRGHAGAHPDDSTERGALDDADIFTRQMLSTSDLRPSTFDLDFQPLPTFDRLPAKPLPLYRRIHAS